MREDYLLSEGILIKKTISKYFLQFLIYIAILQYTKMK